MKKINFKYTVSAPGQLRSSVIVNYRQLIYWMIVDYADPLAGQIVKFKVEHND